MLIRFARFLGSFVLFCECRSPGRTRRRWNARSESAHARGREDKAAVDYECGSFTISADGRTRNVPHYALRSPSLFFFCSLARIFTRGYLRALIAAETNPLSGTGFVKSIEERYSMDLDRSNNRPISTTAMAFIYSVSTPISDYYHEPDELA